MSTFYVAILFMCLNGHCEFVTTDRRVYSNPVECVKDVNDLGSALKKKFPEVVGKGSCVIIKLGEV